MLEDLWEQTLRRFYRRQAGQTVRDALVLAVDLLALGTASQVGEHVFATGFDPLAHLIPQTFDVTAAHQVYSSSSVEGRSTVAIRPTCGPRIRRRIRTARWTCDLTVPIG